MFDWWKNRGSARSSGLPEVPGDPSVGERIEALVGAWNLDHAEAVRLRRGTTSRAVEDVLGKYEALMWLAEKGNFLPNEVDLLKRHILDEGGVDLEWVLQGLAWADEVSSGDANRAWRTLSAVGAADWLDQKYKIPQSSAQKLYRELASMPEYALSGADRIRMREEVAGSGNCLYAAVAARRYILTATMVYQHQVGSKLRPDTSEYASVFSFGGMPSRPQKMTADEIAPPVITREDVAGLRARGYSLLDEGAWNRIIALLRNMHMNKKRISDAERLRREIFAATPEELMSGALDGLLCSRERTP